MQSSRSLSRPSERRQVAQPDIALDCMRACRCDFPRPIVAITTRSTFVALDVSNAGSMFYDKASSSYRLCVHWFASWCASETTTIVVNILTIVGVRHLLFGLSAPINLTDRRQVNNELAPAKRARANNLLARARKPKFHSIIVD